MSSKLARPTRLLLQTSLLPRPVVTRITSSSPYHAITRLAKSSSSSSSSSSNPSQFFSPGPAPPRLPESEQKIFEDLQRRSTGAFSTPQAAEEAEVNASATEQLHESEMPEVKAQVRASGDGDELHPDIRRGAGPEFEGERNPQTGEVGGPKNNPLRWGGDKDWSFNGRVTDF